MRKDKTSTTTIYAGKSHKQQAVSALQIQAGFSGPVLRIFLFQRLKNAVLLTDLHESGFSDARIGPIHERNKAPKPGKTTPPRPQSDIITVPLGKDPSVALNVVDTLEAKGYIAAEFAAEVRTDLPRALAAASPPAQAAPGSARSR